MISDSDWPVFHDNLDDVRPPFANTAHFGHTSVVNYLIKAVIENKLHHGLIFQGERGIGKATTAFHFANWLLSDNLITPERRLPPIDPKSSTFTQIKKNVHPNLLYLTRQKSDDGKRFKQNITVDDVRKVQRFLGLSASKNTWRIIIIDSVNDMNRNSSNALLKLLEEPPENALFIIIAQGAGGVLPTIRSRAQTLKFSHLNQDEFKSALTAADMLDNKENDIHALMSLSDGSVRTALIMNRYGGLELQTALEAILSNPLFDTLKAHKLADIVSARGGETHNELIIQLLLKRITDTALQTVEDGNLNKAQKLASLQSDIIEQVRVAGAFNLNKKQEFLIRVEQTHKVLNDIAA